MLFRKMGHSIQSLYYHIRLCQINLKVYPLLSLQSLPSAHEKRESLFISLRQFSNRVKSRSGRSVAWHSSLYLFWFYDQNVFIENI